MGNSRIMQFYATKGTDMSFIEQLLALFKKTPTTPAEVPPEAVEYNGFLVTETADLMRYLERHGSLCGSATNGVKTAHVEVKVYYSPGEYHNFYARMAAVRARIDNGMHKLPYECGIKFSTFREWNSPLGYTETYFTLHCQIVECVRTSEIIPDDEKILITQALHELKKGHRDERYNY